MFAIEAIVAVIAAEFLLSVASINSIIPICSSDDPVLMWRIEIERLVFCIIKVDEI